MTDTSIFEDTFRLKPGTTLEGKVKSVSRNGYMDITVDLLREGTPVFIGINFYNVDAASLDYFFDRVPAETAPNGDVIDG